jgi:uncharacterized protein (DUF488 family)
MGAHNVRGWEALTRYVSELQIYRVIDVRARPDSNEYWSSGSLMSLLGITYVHAAALGNTMRAGQRWQPPNRRRATAMVEQIAVSLRQDGDLLLLCCETHAQECHRFDVANEIAALIEGAEARHLL